MQSGGIIIHRYMSVLHVLMIRCERSFQVRRSVQDNTWFRKHMQAFKLERPRKCTKLPMNATPSEEVALLHRRPGVPQPNPTR